MSSHVVMNETPIGSHRKEGVGKQRTRKTARASYGRPPAATMTQFTLNIDYQGD